VSTRACGWEDIGFLPGRTEEEKMTRAMGAINGTILEVASQNTDGG